MRMVKMMFCEVWFKKTSGLFSLEKDFKEQIFGKVSHGREVRLGRGDPCRAEMGLARGIAKQLKVGEVAPTADGDAMLSHLVRIRMAPSTLQHAGEKSGWARVLGTQQQSREGPAGISRD